ncbi:MAG: efflux RND transporter periplasmic adaptor subunit [Flavobacteriaceae bacterium]|nr:efflux RND transporter periplasmic adaptor subunit [Flavobacteriaceae bacterium]
MKDKIKYIALFIFLFSIISCVKSEKQQETEIEIKDESTIDNNKYFIKITKSQFDGEQMQLKKMQDIAFPTFIRTTGVIDVPPNNRAAISTFIGGYIKSSPFLVGDEVKKGQALVTIENLDFIEMQQEYIEVKEKLKYLRSDFDRQKELYAEKITSEKSFLKAESEYKRAFVISNSLKKKLSLLNFNIASIEKGNLTSVATIYSPIRGSITDVNINIGTYVSPADKIMEIVNTDHIHLELKVFEKDILKVKEGQKVIFRMPESLDKSFVGDIHLIGKSIDKNRMVQVHAHIEDEYKHNFIVGMFVESDILINDKVSKALPENAIVDVEDKNFVLILKSIDYDDYTFTKKEISIGKTYNGFTEIKGDPFKNDDLFLLGGFNLIQEEGDSSHSH